MKNFVWFLLAIFFVLSLVACSKDDVTAEEVLERICDELSPTPAGELYLSTSIEGEKHFMSSTLFSTVYGDGKSAPDTKIIEEYAIYLSSFSYPFEIAVFKCFSPSDTDKIERLCISRLGVLQRHFSTTEHGTIIDNALVIKDGRFVVMVICDTADDLVQTVKGALS